MCCCFCANFDLNDLNIINNKLIGRVCWWATTDRQPFVDFPLVFESPATSHGTDGQTTDGRTDGWQPAGLMKHFQSSWAYVKLDRVLSTRFIMWMWCPVSLTYSRQIEWQTLDSEMTSCHSWVVQPTDNFYAITQVTTIVIDRQ